MTGTLDKGKSASMEESYTIAEISYIIHSY